MRGLDFELDRLLNPAAVFNHPRDVLNDPDLTRQEKRAILSSWASDACAVDSSPTLRHPPGATAPISFEDIVEALRSLDDDPTRPRPGGLAMRLKSRWRHRGDEEGSNGTSLAADRSFGQPRTMARNVSTSSRVVWNEVTSRTNRWSGLIGMLPLGHG